MNKKIKTGLIGALKFVISPPKKQYFTSAVILAGGSGTRMGMQNGETKQFADIGGMPAVARSVKAFEDCSVIDEIVIVTRKDDFPKYREMLRKYEWKKIKRITVGGNTRAESALNGISKVSDECEFVAVHDAARCLVTPELIERTARAAYEFGAAAPCHRISDTVKIVDKNGFAVSTPDRDTLRAAETPQIMRAELYLASAEYAKKKDIKVTDDCSLAEALGFSVKLVESDDTNIKLTFPRDLETANRILRDRELITGESEEV